MASAVTHHKLYDRNKVSWTSVLDALEGSNAVKLANELYLPMPQGFLEDDTSPSATVAAYMARRGSKADDLKDAPYYHQNKPYMAYLQRARFPEITIFTLRGLLGISTQTDPKAKLPPKIAYLMEKATKKKDTLTELFYTCVSQVLSQGRVTLVLDVNEKDNTLSIVLYDSLSFVNWIDNDTTEETEYALFKECHIVKKSSNVFETEEVEGYVSYSLETKIDTTKEEGNILNKDGEDQLFVTITKKLGDEIVEIATPNLQGTFFPRIPVVTIGSIENRNDPNPPPLLGISEIAYSIYRKDADLSQAQYMTCNPMFTITGSDVGVPTSYGSTVALVLSNPDANAFFPSTDTSALDHVSESIDKLKDEAALYGAGLIGPAKKAAESNETLKTRQGAQGASLVSVVKNVAKGIEDILKLAAEIHGASPDAVEFVANTDFSEKSLSPQMLTSLVQAWLNGGYSLEALVHTTVQSGLVEDGVTVEQEIARLALAGPSANHPADDDEDLLDPDKKDKKKQADKGKKKGKADPEKGKPKDQTKAIADRKKKKQQEDEEMTDE